MGSATIRRVIPGNASAHLASAGFMVLDIISPGLSVLAACRDLEPSHGVFGWFVVNISVHAREKIIKSVHVRPETLLYLRQSPDLK